MRTRQGVLSTNSIAAAGFLLAALFVAALAGCAIAPAETLAPSAAFETVTATPAPPETQGSATTPAPHEAPAPTPFTIVWFPDTQSSAFAEPKALTAMGNWVAEHVQSRNIVCVLQTGDLVDNGFDERQWENFELAYDQFKDKTPYFAIAGNHDLGIKRQSWDGYLARPYAHTVPKAQEYAGGKAAYMLFTAGGVDFLVVGVGYGAEEECAKWIRDVCRAYPDRYGILLVHGFLHGSGDYVDDLGETIYYSILDKCANLYLCLCGHFRGTCYRTYAFDDTYDEIPDRTVHTFLCNYQSFSHNGGQLRLLTFDPADGSLTVDTFSALTNQPMRDNTMKTATFTLPDVLYPPRADAAE